MENNTIDLYGKCPNCKATWDGGDILEELKKLDIHMGRPEKEILELASHFGYTKENKKRFTRVIHNEIRGEHDGVSFTQCPLCKHVWNRFTGLHFPTLQEGIAAGNLKPNSNSQPIQEEAMSETFDDTPQEEE